MLIKKEINVPVLNKELQRRLYVYLPDSYYKSNKNYPVLYMFDGHNVFFDSDATYKRSWRMKEYLDSNSCELIIAAVECNYIGNGRLSEYSPCNFSDKNFGDIKGLGKQYMEWLVTELKPYIDSHYKTLTDKENTAIAGSSMGGLMTVYAMNAYNDIFSKGAALSPSLWCRPDFMITLLNEKNNLKNERLYLSYGKAESGYTSKMKEMLHNVYSLMSDKGADVFLQIDNTGTHCEASWEKMIPYFMKYLNF